MTKSSESNRGAIAFKWWLFGLPFFLLLSSCDKFVESAESSRSPAITVYEDTRLNSATGDEFSQVIMRSTLYPDAEPELLTAGYATTGKIQASEQRTGDIDKGRAALIENDYVGCGIPERVFRQLISSNSVTELPDRNSRAQGLPFSTNVTNNSDGLSVVSNNCLTCHGTVLFGELHVGLGNEFLDFTGNASVLAERAGALVNGDDEIRAWELYADRIAAIAPYVKTKTVGVNPANNLTMALIAHRQAHSNAWSDKPLLPMPPEDPPPVSVPPWWRMAKKPAMFSMGEGRLDHARIMMSASMLCTDTLEELEKIDAYAPDIRQYIASLAPPQWPFDINQALIAKGEKLFEESCSQCHGRYGENAQYPARLVPIETVQTDSSLIDFAQGIGAYYIDWFNRSFYGETSIMSPGAGYVAPPLDGIWATAPFLHNGSVPTIRALLDSGSRPGIWHHSVKNASDPASYDQNDMGWLHEELQPSESSEKTDSEIGKQIYDTRLNGYSNEGHLFGDHLSNTERDALIEYLKTL
ncbi:MAG: hypothetical protein AB8B79_04615 [Granulosicoccus sp.]